MATVVFMGRTYPTPQYASPGKDWRPEFKESADRIDPQAVDVAYGFRFLGYMQAQKTGKAARPRNRRAFAAVCLP